MSLDQKILEELKEKLLTERVRVEEELNRIAKPTTASGDFSTNFSEIGTDEDDNASEVEEYTDNLAIETTLEKQLKEILEALQRIENGNYGKCENCDAEIPVERLRAYPAAKKCTNC
jgi:RNA polymerase-binding protein DksA